MKKKFLVFLFPLFVLLLALNAQRGVEANSEYIGSEICKGCHQDKYESYSNTLHAIKADPRTPASRQGCESCHGPGSEHVNKGGGRGVGGILALSPKSPIPAEKKSAICLQCHTKGKTAMWDGSAHDGRGLSCSNCHSIHSGNPKNLAGATEVEVCSKCHLQVRAEIRRQSHHPIREGKINCSNCHNPHGTVADKLISANYLNEKCYECHAEKRGPFLWEHAPVTENCTTCHNPHGSSHDKLLVAKRPYLCQTCHSNSRHPGTLYALNSTNRGSSVYRVLNSRIYNRSCQNCHYQIHGSNHPSGKSLMR